MSIYEKYTRGQFEIVSFSTGRVSLEYKLRKLLLLMDTVLRITWAITLLTWYLPAQKNNSTGFLRSSKFEIRVQIFSPNWHLVNDNWLKSNEFISDLSRYLLYTLHWDNNLVILTLNTVSMFTKKYSYNSLSN